MLESGLIVVMGVVGGVGFVVVVLFVDVGYEVIVLIGCVLMYDYLCGFGVIDFFDCEEFVVKLWLIGKECFGGGVDIVGLMMFVNVIV